MDITTWCFSPLEMLGQAFTAPASSYCSVLSSCTKEHPLLVCDQVTDMTVEEYHISSPQKLGTVKRCPIGCAAFGSIWAGQCIPNFLRMHYIADLAPFFLCDTFVLFCFLLDDDYPLPASTSFCTLHWEFQWTPTMCKCNTWDQLWIFYLPSLS